MLKAHEFLEQCKLRGHTFFSGTPCSYLKPLINATIDDPEVDYYDATNEGDAVAMVCGAYVSHRKGVVMFQNSGLGNAVNALTSLSYPFQIPFLIVVTHRGQPGGPADEPQHQQMGEISEELLSTLGIQWELFPENSEQLQLAFQRAEKYMVKRSLPYAFLMRSGSVAPQELKKKIADNPIGQRKIEFSESINLKYSQRSTRTEALKILLKYRDEDDIFVATTGKTGRELYTLEDRATHFYMVGSMGSASSFSLGAAINTASKRFITIDGDAALLMRMGNLASVGVLKPKNYLHVLLDNEVNDSTGGQGTPSSNIPFAGIADACGYEKIYSTDQITELETIFSKTKKDIGPVFIHFRIKKGSPKELGRPKVTPKEVKERLMKLLSR